MSVRRPLSYREEARQYYTFNHLRVRTQKRLSLRFRYCFLSDKLIWPFQKCTVVITSENKSFWCDTHEFLIDKIKRL